MSRYNNKHVGPSLTKTEQQLVTGVARAIEDSQAALRELSRMPGAQLSCLSVCQNCGGAGAVDSAESSSTSRAEEISSLEGQLTNALDRNNILTTEIRDLSAEQMDLKAKQFHCEVYHPQTETTEFGLTLQLEQRVKEVDQLGKRIQYSKRASITGVAMVAGALIAAFVTGAISDDLFAGIASALMLTSLFGLIAASWGMQRINSARSVLTEAETARNNIQAQLHRKRGHVDANPWRDMVEAPVDGSVIDAIDASGRVTGVSFRFVDLGPRISADWYPVGRVVAFTPVLWRSQGEES